MRTAIAIPTGSFPMGRLEMSGSYPPTDEAIDGELSRTPPGNYALGYMDGNTFMVFCVGRSDSDVRDRPHDWVGAPSRHERYAPSAKAASGAHQRQPLPRDVPALARVGVEADSSYTRSMYSYAPSAQAAFEKEWRNHDDFGAGGGLDNAAPPSRRREAPGECVKQRT
jgi:hypothetical protein